MKTCSVEGCGRPYAARGYCHPHWKRWRRHGDPLAGNASPGAPLEWVNEVAVHYQGAGCLKWPFADSGNGYGRIEVNGRPMYAHRLVCKLVHGEPSAPDDEAAHSCGNGAGGCVNPSHLRWASRSGNFADKILHGTHNRGVRHPSSKLTEADVRSIKEDVGSSQRKLARTYGVSQQTISDIRRGRRWGWL